MESFASVSIYLPARTVNLLKGLAPSGARFEVQAHSNFTNRRHPAPLLRSNWTHPCGSSLEYLKVINHSCKVCDRLLTFRERERVQCVLCCLGRREDAHTCRRSPKLPDGKCEPCQAATGEGHHLEPSKLANFRAASLQSCMTAQTQDAVMCWNCWCANRAIELIQAQG